MVDVRGDVLRPPHGTTPAAVKSNMKSEIRSFKSNENIHKKEGGSYYVVSANKASSVTGLSPPPQYFFTERSKAVLLLWFLSVACSCCPYLYFGSAIMLVTIFVNFR